jgi:hypothetical protein
LGKKLTHIKTIITETNRTVHYVSVTLSCAIFLIAIILISNWFFKWLSNAPKFSLTIAVVTGAFCVYHQLANALELRKIGLPTIMNWVARWLLARNFQHAALSHEVDISKLKITGGRIELTEASMSTELRPLFSEP